MDFTLQTFNTQISVTRLANVHYFEFTSHYHTKNDAHNFCELLFVDKGSINVYADNYTGVLGVNQMIIHRPMEVHSLSGKEHEAPNVIIIGFECDAKELIMFSKSPVTLMPERRKLLSNILSEAMSIYEPPYDVPNTPFMKKREVYPFGADQMVRMWLETFLIAVIRDFTNGTAPDAREESVTNLNISAVHKYLCDNYTSKIYLDNLCFLFGTNKTTLCRNFKNEYGMTVHEYVSMLKLREAKAYLREGNMSIAQISEVLGFESVHYFCRVFRKMTGQTAMEYLKSVKAKLEL